MKKILLLIIPILGLILYSSSGLIFFTMQKDGGYAVYTENQTVDEYSLSPFDAYMLCLKTDELGVSVKLSDSDYLPLTEKLSAELVYTEKLDGLTLYYYHSPFLKKHVVLNDQTINLQIAVNDNGTVIAGTPIILGSY